jgi:pimeloyl-ACP methyl ester carboxylesterase
VRSGLVTLLFIHGAGCSKRVFDAQLDALPQAHAGDLPGHFCAGAPASIAEFADAVESWMEGPAVLCGHSMGAAIALEIALRRPNRLRALVLLGGGAKLRVAPAIFEGLERDFEGTARDLAQNYFFSDPRPAWVDMVLHDMLALGAQVIRDYQACDVFNALDRLGEISVPLLAITGENDKMTPPKYAQTFADRVPRAQARIIPGAGHFVMVERAEETNAAIRAFLSGIV